MIRSRCVKKGIEGHCTNISMSTGMWVFSNLNIIVHRVVYDMIWCTSSKRYSERMLTCTAICTIEYGIRPVC